MEEYDRLLEDSLLATNYEYNINPLKSTNSVDFNTSIAESFDDEYKPLKYSEMYMDLTESKIKEFKQFMGNKYNLFIQKEYNRLFGKSQQTSKPNLEMLKKIVGDKSPEELKVLDSKLNAFFDKQQVKRTSRLDLSDKLHLVSSPTEYNHLIPELEAVLKRPVKRCNVSSNFELERLKFKMISDLLS